MKKLFMTLVWCFLSFFTAQAQVAQDFDYQEVMTLKGHNSSIHNLRFSPDGKSLATCGFDNKVILWDVATGQMKYEWDGHTDWVTEVTFSKDGKLIASAGQDGVCRVWNVENGELMATFESIPFTIRSKKMTALAFVVFSNDNKHIYFGGASAILMKAFISEPEKPVEKVTMLHNGGKFYTNITGGEIMADGKTMVVSIGNFVVVVDVETGMMLKKFFYPLQGINDVVVTPDNQKIAAWTFDGHVVIWDYQSMQMLKNLTVTTPKNYSAAAFSGDAVLLATGASGNVAKVWNWESGDQLATLEGHTQIIRTVRFNPAKNMIATASYDKTVKIWQPKNEIEPEVSIHEKDLKIGNTINLKHIRFEQSKAIFLEESYPELQKLLELMQKHPSMTIQLNGHTDNVGKPHLNLRLSGERVRVVKKYLTERGIDEKRIVPRAYGDTRPIADNTNEQTRRLNRRVEVTILAL